jgi:beta-lactamase regulating signal transducer with metallopeptidase domain
METLFIVLLLLAFLIFVILTDFIFFYPIIKQNKLKQLNHKKMDFLKLQEVTFHKIDEDNEIEIEVEGWGHYISIEETEKLIEFLTIQLKNKKEINKLS